MTQFLAEWALRSSILIVCGTLLIRALRVKDPSLRLAAWTAILCGSLAIPALTAVLPKLPIAVMRVAPSRVEAPLESPPMVPEPTFEPGRALSRPDARVVRPAAVVSKPFNWARAAVMVYVLVAVALLLRLGFGLTISLRLLRRSRVTGQATEGIQIRESDRVTAPVALGIVRPAIVLPGDWRQWDGPKLDAVLAHEYSHIRRHDPAVQLLSAIHRALLWHSPLSWFLHRRIVRAAEEASDDAALGVIHDRALYAEVLLEFMQRGVRGVGWQGAPMARYGRPDKRIHRILDGTALSRGVTKLGLAAILILGLPLAYLVAAAYPETAPLAQATTAPIAPVQTAEKPPALDALPVKPSGQNSGGFSAFPGGGLVAPQSAAQSAAATKQQPLPVNLSALASAAASTIHVRPFVMEQAQFRVDHGKEQVTSRDIVSRRRDGAYSNLATLYGPSGPNEVRNTIRFPNGLKVWTFEEIRARSTTMEPANQLPDYMTMTMLTNPPDGCVEQGDKDDTRGGEEYMLGYRTARLIAYYADSLTRWVDWRLPDFNCTRVQAFIQKRADTSSQDWNTVQGERTLNFAERDPNPSVFADWTGYQEMKPSDMVAAFLVFKGSTPVEAHKQVVQITVREDKEYAERHPQ